MSDSPAAMWNACLTKHLRPQCCTLAGHHRGWMESKSISIPYWNNIHTVECSGTICKRLDISVLPMAAFSGCHVANRCQKGAEADDLCPRGSGPHRLAVRAIKLAPSTAPVAAMYMLTMLGQRPLQTFPQLAAGLHPFRLAVQVRVFFAFLVASWLAILLAHYPRCPRTVASKQFPNLLWPHFQYASHSAICSSLLACVQNAQNLFE